MGRYDDTNFTAPVPGIGDYGRGQGMSAPGTGGMVPGSDEGAVLATVTVTGPLGRPIDDTMSVDVNDTTRDGQYPAREAFSGVALGGTGAGSGRPRGAGHPNSMTIGASSSGPEAG